MGRPAYFRARAGFQVLAWCLMSNHYHLALRMGGRADLRSSQRSPAVVEAREAVAWVAVVLYGFQVKEVARGLEEYVETASRLVGRVATRRVEDEGLRAMVRAVEASIIDGFRER